MRKENPGRVMAEALCIETALARAANDLVASRDKANMLRTRKRFKGPNCKVPGSKSELGCLCLFVFVIMFVFVIEY